MMQAASELKGYDAYGNLRTGAVPDPFGYCGEYYDNETDLIYLRNRYYDSTKGIFITEDPAKDGFNWYSYCAGDPVNAWDPLGLFVNGDQYLTPEHVGQILLSTLVYYAGEKIK